MSQSKSMSVPEVFERALEEILARVCASDASTRVAEALQQPSIAIAYSGGLDSAVLLHLADRYACVRGIKLFAFHVHHGLSPNADHWLAHCQHEAERLGIAFDCRKIALENSAKSGVEEAARLGRYSALGQLCADHGVKLLLTAHHQDDQAETIMLQLLRGSGVPGLTGMEDTNNAAELCGNAQLTMARPLLAVLRADLEDYARAKQIAYVDDESNGDPRYARNALRHHVMPAVSEFFSGYQRRLARTGMHMQSAQRLLDELAKQDLGACMVDGALALERLGGYSSERIDNLLRYWLSACGLRMPSTAWLSEMRKQLFEAKDDAQVCVKHPDGHIRRFQHRVFLTPAWMANTATLAPIRFHWRGETAIKFPQYRGVLLFEAADEGLAPEWLRQQELLLRHRQGGEQVKLAENRPTRSLKHHYQALAVPPWQRLWLPLVCAGNELLFAAGIGMHWQQGRFRCGEGVRLRWQLDQ